VPVGALTAWQGCLITHDFRLENAYSSRRSRRGSIFATQPPDFAGARVTATASARNLAFVTGWERTGD